MGPMEGVEWFMFGQMPYNGVNITVVLDWPFSLIPGFHPCGKAIVNAIVAHLMILHSSWIKK